jgi:hypothetical protein
MLQLQEHLNQTPNWREALSQISARAGCNVRTGPNYTSVGVAAAGCQGTQADIEVTLPRPHGPTFLDISMIHPRCPTYGRCFPDAGRRCRSAGQEQVPCACGTSAPQSHFVLVSVEANWHLRKPIMRYIRSLNHVASVRSRLSPGGRFLLVPTGTEHRSGAESGLCVQISCAIVPRLRGRADLPGADAPFLD